jgi:hypothetical protein
VDNQLGPRMNNPRRWLVVGMALFLLAILGALWIARPRAPVASIGQLYFVDDTTLVVLQGDVQLQPSGGSGFEPVKGKRALQVGDRVRTGTDGYAWILFADSSSASLGPDTELALLGVEPDPTTGLATVVQEQTRGTVWRVAAVRGAVSPAVVVESPAGRFVARGGQFSTQVAPDGTLAVTAVEGTIEGHAEAGDVDVPSGFATRVALGRAPTVPVPAAVPLVTLQVAVQGPVSALLTDARGRSVGFPPAADSYVSQIPGARLGRGDRGAQVFTVPAPVERYTLTLQGQALGQAVVDVTALRSDAPSAVGAARVQAGVGQGQLLATSFEWRAGAIGALGALTPTAGPPPDSAIAFIARPPVSAVAAPTTVRPRRAPAPAEASDGPAAAAAGLPDGHVNGSVEAGVVGAEPTPPAAPVGLAPQPAPPPAPPGPPAVEPPAARGPEASAPGAVSARPAPTEVPLAVGVVLELPTAVPPSPPPPTAAPATSVPATLAPPTTAPTAPPPTVAPTPTRTPSPTVVPRTVVSSHPAIAPTATAYRPPAPPVTPRPTPTRCLYPC